LKTKFDCVQIILTEQQTDSTVSWISNLLAASDKALLVNKSLRNICNMNSSIENLLNSLERNETEEAVQETLAEIKRHLIQSAEASKNVLSSSSFFNYTNS
jgi:hypothetical protein